MLTSIHLSTKWWQFLGPGFKALVIYFGISHDRQSIAGSRGRDIGFLKTGHFMSDNNIFSVSRDLSSTFAI